MFEDVWSLHLWGTHYTKLCVKCFTFSMLKQYIWNGHLVRGNVATVKPKPACVVSATTLLSQCYTQDNICFIAI